MPLGGVPCQFDRSNCACCFARLFNRSAALNKLHYPPSPLFCVPSASHEIPAVYETYRIRTLFEKFFLTWTARRLGTSTVSRWGGRR